MATRTIIIASIFLLIAITSVKAATDIFLEMDYRTLQGIVSRGIGNNNPFNIKVSGREYAGKVPRDENTDIVHEQFVSFPYGIAAGIDHLRKRYILGQNSWGVGKLDTIRKIIEVYAPSDSGEGNEPNVYAAYLERKTGISQNAKLDANDKETLFDLTRAMLIFENGAKYESSYFSVKEYTNTFELAWVNILNLP